MHIEYDDPNLVNKCESRKFSATTNNNGRLSIIFPCIWNELTN